MKLLTTITLASALLMSATSHAIVCIHTEKEQARLEDLAQVAHALDISNAKELVATLISEVGAQGQAETALQLVVYVENVNSCSESIDPKLTAFEAALFRHGISKY